MIKLICVKLWCQHLNVSPLHQYEAKNGSRQKSHFMMNIKCDYISQYYQIFMLSVQIKKIEHILLRFFCRIRIQQKERLT